MIEAIGALLLDVAGAFAALGRRLRARDEGHDVYPWPGADAEYERKYAAARARYRRENGRR